MPIYEYLCGECGESSEKIITAVDPNFNYDSLDCDCGGVARRRISAPSSLNRKVSGQEKCPIGPICGNSDSCDGPIIVEFIGKPKFDA